MKIIQILREFICFIKPLLILYSTTHTSSPHLLTKNIFQSQSHTTSQCTNTTTIVLSSKLFTYSVLISLLFQNLIFNSKYIFKSLLKLRILNCQLKYVGVQRHNIEIEYILFGGQIMLKWFLHQKIEKLNKHKRVCNIFCNTVSLFFLNEINFYMIWSFIFFYKYLEIAFRSNKIAIVHFSFK